jgi:voltage-gated potassium channel
MRDDLRARTYRLLAPEKGGLAGYLTDWFIMALIAANVTAVMAGTVDAIGEQYATELFYFEAASVAVFTVEYLGRLWSYVEDPDYESRLVVAFRPTMIVDFLAILPFYLVVLGVPGDLRFLRALRLLRVLRLLKLTRYSESMRAFKRVFLDKKPDLLIALFANIILLVVSSSTVYIFENPVQPEAYPSIPATLWWGMITLTTVGYGDVTPVTPLGQFFGAITALLGVGVFALPASILASGFIEEAGTEGRTCPHCGEVIELR